MSERQRRSDDGPGARLRAARVGVACAVALTLSVPAVAAQEGAAVEPGPDENTIDVTKLVEGQAPTGASFEITVHCSDLDEQVGQQFIERREFAPGETGSFLVPGASVCEVTESDPGGADAVRFQGASEQAAVEAGPSSVTIDFGDGTGLTATVTVTNTFAELTDGEVLSATAEAGQVVQADPGFTG